MRHDEMQKETIDVTVKCNKLTKPIFDEICKQLNKQFEKVKNAETDLHQQMKSKKISMNKLKKSGGALVNMKIGDDNLKSFDKFAKKYNVEYSLKKDKSTEPATYHIFFKANDFESINKAVGEYVKNNEKIANRKPIKERLQDFKSEIQVIKQQHREHKKEKGEQGR